MTAVKGIVLTVTVAAMAAAQTPAGPALEVASIRVSANSDSIQQGKVAVGVRIDGLQVRAVAFTLKDYLGMAYQMKIAQISGPDWTGSDRFDVSATIPAGGNAAQIDEMFQSLLESASQKPILPADQTGSQRFEQYQAETDVVDGSLSTIRSPPSARTGRRPR